jgi:hypothetical protein
MVSSCGGESGEGAVPCSGWVSLPVASGMLSVGVVSQRVGCAAFSCGMDDTGKLVSDFADGIVSGPGDKTVLPQPLKPKSIAAVRQKTCIDLSFLGFGIRIFSLHRFFRLLFNIR